MTDNIRRIKDVYEQNKQIVVFGAGQNGISLIYVLIHNGVRIRACFDNDKYKSGQVLWNSVKVSLPYRIEEDIIVLVCTYDRELYEAVKLQCERMGYKEFWYLSPDNLKEAVRLLPDKEFIELTWRIHMGSYIDLNNPKTFNEKIQWLKLYDRNPAYTQLVDKYAVKSVITERFGEKYIIPTLGLYERFEDIRFETLPQKFAMKCTHDSGSYVICRDKKDLEISEIKEMMEESLARNYYYCGREWPYKEIPPRIIIEEFFEDSEGVGSLSDYKFYCFNGYVDCVMVCFGRETDETKYYFFDAKWNLKRINKRGKEAPEGFTLPRPRCLDEMFDLATKLSEGIPFVRVDLYQSNNRVLFGELTFYPAGGFDLNYLAETDEYFGELIDLNEAYFFKSTIR